MSGKESRRRAYGLSAEADIMRLAPRCINRGDMEDSAVRANRVHYPAVKRRASRDGQEWKSRVLKISF